METYKTVIRPNEHLKRNQDAFQPGLYPHNIWDVQAVFLKENREYTPSYQERPDPHFNILHAVGGMDDEIYKNIEESCGLSRPKEKMYTLHNLVYGLGRHWGPNVFLSTLILSNDLLSEEPHATALEDKDWDYQFTPGLFRLGYSGRILQDMQESTIGKKFIWR